MARTLGLPGVPPHTRGQLVGTTCSPLKQAVFEKSYVQHILLPIVEACLRAVKWASAGSTNMETWGGAKPAVYKCILGVFANKDETVGGIQLCCGSRK